MAFWATWTAELRGLIHEGGWILVSLLVLAFAIALNLIMIATAPARCSASEASRVQRRIDFCFVLIGAAPLIGLLGTVSGMLKTFSGLASRAATAPMESISRGISEALITTQTGLVIAVPTFIVCTLLKRWHVLHRLSHLETSAS